MESINYLSMTLQQLMQCPAAKVHEIMEQMDRDLLTSAEVITQMEAGQTSFAMNVDAVKVQASQISFLRIMLTGHHKILVETQINRPGASIVSPEFRFDDK